MMTIGCNIPLDLIIEILIRLPAKSVSRFRYVSKSWFSIITSQQFIDTFMSGYVTRPRLVIAFYDRFDDQMLFNFSPHQSGSLLSSSSMLVAEKNTLTIPKVNSYYNLGTYVINSVRGFVCCLLGNQIVVCNPTTGQVIPLAAKNNDDNYECRIFLGYDSNSDQYKVLRLMAQRHSSRIEHSVRTLGGKGSSNSWRPIKTNITHYIRSPTGVCIDGVVYYEYSDHGNIVGLGSFDVGSEQLRHIGTPEDLSGVLTNYLEKLAVYRYYGDNGCMLWILDDVKNQIWSKMICIFQSFTRSMFPDFRFGGVSSSGEIVYVARCDSDSLELFCYDVEKTMGRKVKVEGFSKIGCLYPLILCSYEENIVYL